MKNGKSQLYGHIFIYVLSIILISFILIYGYNSIQSFKKRAEQISCLKFKNDLQSSVKAIMGDYGSVRIKDLQLCADYKQVCFIETYDCPGLPADCPGVLGQTQDPIMRDSLSSNTGDNIFLVESIAKDSFYAGNISVEPDIFCINVVNGKISLRLEGRGDHVLLRQN